MESFASASIRWLRSRKNASASHSVWRFIVVFRAAGGYHLISCHLETAWTG